MIRKPLALLVAATITGILFTSSAVANEAFDKAQKFIEAKDYNSAVIELKNAVQQDPKSAAARLLLGTTYIKINRWPSAEKELIKASELGADKIKWMQPLAQVLSAQGKVGEVSRYIKLDESDPANVKSEALAILGMVNVSLDKVADAKGQFDQAMQLNPDNLQALLGLTNVALRQQEYSLGLDYAEKVLKKDKSNLDGLLLKSQLLAINGDLETAFITLQMAIDTNPMFIQARLLRTNLNLSQQKFSEAKIDIDYLQQIIPGNFLVELLNGKYHLMQKEYDKASEFLLSAQSKISRAHPELEKLLGLLDIHEKNWEQAELHLSTSLQLNKGDTAVALLLANLYSNQLSQPLKAIPVYERLLKIHPSAQDIIVRLSDAYNRTGDVDKATELLERKLAGSEDSSRLQTMLAQIKLTSGEMAEAISMLESNSKAGESSLQNAWLAMSYIRQGAFDKAERLVTGVLKKEPQNALFNNILGVSSLAQKKFSDALSRFEKAVETNPKYLAAQFNIVRAYRAQEKNDKVLKKLNALDKVFENNAKVAFALYQANLSDKNTKEAERWLKISVDRDGAFDPAVSNLITVHMRDNNKVEALAIANQFVAIESNNAEAHFQLGRIYLSEPDNSRISQAIESFQMAVNIAPKQSRYALALGRTYMIEKNQEAALKILDRFLLGSPSDAAVTSAKIKLLTGRKNYKGALLAIDSYARAADNDPLVNELKGDVAVAQEQIKDAIKLYSSAHKERASSRLAVKLHQNYAKLKQKKEAEQVLVDWLKQTPKDVFVHFGLANWYQQEKQNDKAIEQYEQTIKYNPNYLFALNNLAWIYMEKNDKRALDLAKRVELLKPKRADVLDTVGWIYVQFGLAKKGLPLLEQALKINPELREARYHAAVAHHKVGNNKQAKELIGDLVQSGKPFMGQEEAKELLKKL